jgi:hypothetical protein
MEMAARTSWRATARRVARIAGEACVAAGITAWLAAPALAAAPRCVTTHERASLDARLVKEYLMVAALNCDARQQYNSFVTKYEPDLKNHAVVLRRHFARAYGSKSEREIDRYVTAAANEASIVSNADRAGFCRRSTALLNELNGRKKASLEPATYRTYVQPSHLRAPVCQEAKR